MSKCKISRATKVRLLYAVSFLDLFACSLVIPLLSSQLRSLGASHFCIGALSSLYAGLQLVSGPVIGSWSDIHGHCFVLQLSLFCCSFLYFVMGAVTAIPIITIARIGLGLLKHTQSLCRTLLADIVHSKDQMVTQSRLVSFGAVGFIIGPAIGGHLAEVEGGFFYICSIVMLFFWVNYAIVYLFLHEKSTGEKGTQTSTSNLQNSRRTGSISHLENVQQFSRSFLRNYKAVNVRNHLSVITSSTKKVCSDASLVVKNLSRVDWPVYWDVFTLKFLLGFALAVHFQNFTLMLKDMYNVSPKWIGYTISLQGFVSATTGFTTNWISGFYCDDRSNLLRTLHGFVVLTVAVILLSIAPNLTFVVLFLMPLSAAGSVLRITTSEIILQRTAPHQRGSLIGSGQSMASVARLLAPLCSGIAYDMFGFHGTSILKIGTAATGAVLANCLYIQQHKRKRE